MPSRNLKIEELRAIAILLVMAQHLNGRLPMPAFYGAIFRHLQFWPGVDVFFAISGYLIAGNFLALLQSSPTKITALRRFAVRRFWRLMPALLFWLAASITLAAWIGNPRLATHGAVAATLGVANLYWHHCLATGASSCGSLDFNSVTWSLSLEFQLYALASVLLVLLRPRFAIAILLALGLFDACFPATLFSLPWLLRPGAFALGAAAAITRLPARLAWLDRTLLIGGITLAIAAPRQLPAPFVLGTIAIGGFMALVSCLGTPRPASRTLVWIGQRSYSLYLCHLLAILLVARLRLPWFTAPALALIAAHISYELIETRLRRLTRHQNSNTNELA